MSTTTIRIEEDMKARISAAAQRAGKSTHAFIVDAIAQNVEQAELDDAFQRLAEERWAGLLADGKSISWDEGRKYLEARARGEHPPKPEPRTPGG